MFFDRLLKLQTLKFRLLGSTSFAQLYSAERLPLRKFRKEGAMLSPLIAGLLAACGGGGKDVLKAGDSATHIFGGDGNDKLTGGASNDVIYGDAGRDVLRGNKGADVFVAQMPTARIGLTDHMDTVKDFKIGEDKIGLLNFNEIEKRAQKNDGNYEEAKSDYLADLTKRADKNGKSEIELLLKDLGFSFTRIRDGEGSDRKPAWTLSDVGKKRGIGDDTALLSVANLDAENEYIDNPFLDQTVEALFEFL